MSQPAHTYERTDLGNTEYFVDLYGSILRFDQSRRRWLVWTGHRWQPDHLKRAEEAVQLAARRRLHEAIQMPLGNGTDPVTGNKDPATEARNAAVKWAKHSESRYSIDHVVSLAQKNSKISVQTAYGWDANPWLMGTPNGVVDLQTGRLRSGDQEDKITKQTGITYNPDAKCPRFERFLSEILSGHAELIDFVRKALGYTLSGDLREDCWFGCYGTGSNGKSTLFDVIHTVLGEYAYTAPFALVEKGSQGGRRDFDIAYLQNMRFVMAGEVAEGSSWDEERLKRLSGGDMLHAEIKHGAEFEFKPSHKLWFMFNHQPRVKDQSPGFWRRVRLIPFNQKFTEETADKNLEYVLRNELQGIFAYLVRACIDWQREGLSTPRIVLNASKLYEEEQDPILGFVAKHTKPDGPGFNLATAYALYKKWCKKELIDHPIGKNNFSQMLPKHGFTRTARKDITFYAPGELIDTCVCMTVPCVCAHKLP